MMNLRELFGAAEPEAAGFGAKRLMSLATHLSGRSALEGCPAL